jgi:hypothetical protein
LATSGRGKFGLRHQDNYEMKKFEKNRFWNFKWKYWFLKFEKNGHTRGNRNIFGKSFFKFEMKIHFWNFKKKLPYHQKEMKKVWNILCMPSRKFEMKWIVFMEKWRNEMKKSYVYATKKTLPTIPLYHLIPHVHVVVVYN